MPESYAASKAAWLVLSKGKVIVLQRLPIIEHRERTPYTLAAFNWRNCQISVRCGEQAVKKRPNCSMKKHQVDTNKTNSSKGSTVPKPDLASLFIRQLLVVAMVGAALIAIDFKIAMAWIVGALLYILPQTYFAIRAFRYRGAAQMQHAYLSTNQGLMGKWLLFATGLVLVFRFWPEVSLPALFIGYLLAQIGGWISYTILINRPLGGK